MSATTVTQKGQTTIPVSIRRKLGLKPGNKVLFEERGEEVILKPAVKISLLRGSLKTLKKYSKTRVKQAVGDMLVLRHEKTARY